MVVKKRVFVGLLFVLMVILIVVFFQSGSKDEIKLTSSPSSLESEMRASGPREMRKVVLFFLSERDNLFHPEERLIEVDKSIVLMAKRTIEELMKGSQRGFISPFPPGIKLREVFLCKEGILYVDFSKDIQSRHLYGSNAEISTIFSTVNSLAYNFKPIKKVFILINGDEKETLGGHIDLTHPLVPHYDLIVN